MTASTSETVRHEISIHGGGTTSIHNVPSARISLRKQQTLFVQDTYFKFAFAIGEEDGYLNLTCSNRDDISALVDDWLEDYEIEPEFFRPVRNPVEHVIEGITENPRHEVMIIPREHTMGRPNQRAQLPPHSGQCCQSSNPITIRLQSDAYISIQSGL